MKDVKIDRRKKVRYDAIKKHFFNCHGKNPQTKIERYIFRLIVDLGEVYDENQEEIRRLLLLKSVLKVDGTRSDILKVDRSIHRLQLLEQQLNLIGHNLRESINISIKDQDSDYNRRLNKEKEDEEAVPEL